MDLLQEAFIHPPEPCEGRFITDAHTFYFTSSELLMTNTHSPPLKDLEGPFLI